MQDIKKFIAGFERFQAKYFGEDRSLYDGLVQVQNPRAFVISCCDSRVDPAMLTDADPGDMFVVRNIANLVPPYRHEAEAPGIRSAIEFAVRNLEVGHIIVLGHSNCGGIQALMDIDGLVEKQYEFIAAWVSVAKRARDHVLESMPDATAEEQARACERQGILVSLANLVTFPWIRERVETGKLMLHGWYFDIEAGELLAYSPATGVFSPLTSSIHDSR